MNNCGARDFLPRPKCGLTVLKYWIYPITKAFASFILPKSSALKTSSRILALKLSQYPFTHELLDSIVRAVFDTMQIRGSSSVPVGIKVETA